MTEKDATMSGVWTRYDYPDGSSLWQRECPDCDLGLLVAPVRNCLRCGGTGYLVTASEVRDGQ